MKALIRYRATRLRRALLCYDTAFELDNCLLDLLADARHWCDRYGHSFVNIDRKAHRAYTEEVVAAGKAKP